jgi:hypothetical protein
MATGTAFATWWRPLPLWLKVLFVAVAWPAWAVGLFCVLTGRADSPLAYAALAVFGLCAVIGVISESRKRRSVPHESNGLDVSDGGE